MPAQWKMATGNWELRAGKWEMETANWRQAADGAKRIRKDNNASAQAQCTGAHQFRHFTIQNAKSVARTRCNRRQGEHKLLLGFAPKCFKLQFAQYIFIRLAQQVAGKMLKSAGGGQMDRGKLHPQEAI